MNYFAIGSYTESAPHLPDAAGKGIYIVSLDPDSGELKLESTLGGIINPSYLAWDREGSHLYGVTESMHDAGAVAAFTLHENFSLETINSVVGPGKSNCHILHLPARNLIIAASYQEGRLNAYSLKSGRIGAVISDITYAGSGPNARRQTGPHAHQALGTPDGNGLLVCDLGSDAVWYHDIDNLDSPPTAAFSAPAGYGPRHMALDPDGRHAYLLCELKPRLLVLKFAADWRSAEVIAEHDTAPGFTGDVCAPAAVKLHPSGKSVAVSNRFADTITVFTIHRDDTKGVKLSFTTSLPSGGRTPRDIEFSADGRWLIIANQDSSILNSLPFDPESGLPAEDEAFSLLLGTPACVVELA